MQARKRNSRYGDEPILNKDGKPVRAIINDRRQTLLSFLERHRYATFRDMHGYLGGDPRALRYTIRVLKAKPNSYIKVCDQHAEDRNLRSKLAYELDKGGIEYLRKNGRPVADRRYVRNFTHAELASHATGSIETGAVASEKARIIPWQEILASKRMPAPTKSSDNPAGIPTAYEVEGVTYAKIVRADSFPFGIVLTLPNENKFRFFPGIEADMGTEPIHVTDFERTSIFSKFKAYLAIEANETYHSHFGFPIFFVPFLTTTPTRMRSMMEELRRITGGRGSKTLLFKVVNREGDPGYLFNEPWERVGYDPIIFAK